MDTSARRRERSPIRGCCRLRAAGARATLALTALGPSPPLGAARAQAASNSADRVVFWTGFQDVVGLTDAQLDAFASMGVDGIVMSAGHLRGLGGSQDWTSDPTADLSASRYDNQRQVRNSRIVQRAAVRCVDLDLGWHAVNYSNTSTPYRDWFDDSGWELVTKKIADLAGTANMLGFRGLAIDQELYPQRGGVETATWNWSYPGNIRSETQVRAKARQRGEQVMRALLGAFPGVEIGLYNFLRPDSWHNVVQDIASGGERARIYDKRADVDFWNGMTAVEGWRAVRSWNNIFYKSWHRGSAPSEQLRWENAMLWDVSQAAQLLSRRFDNWEYARSRFHISPFAWINEGPSARQQRAGGEPVTAFDRARPVPYVETQLMAMRKWGMGGGFANYHYGGGFGPSVYADYADVIRAASTPGDVDSEPPLLEVTGGGSTISGTATDDLAIWSVRWRDDRGGSGTAELTFNVTEGDRLYIRDWQMDWELPRSELTPGATSVRVIASDIKGNESAPVVISLGGRGRTTAPASAPPSPASGTLSPVGASRLGRTKITRKPPRRLTVKARRPVVRFAFCRSQPTLKFRCRLNQRRWRNCSSGEARYRIGARPRWRIHAFTVVAIDREGNRDPARYRFRVRRR